MQFFHSNTLVAYFDDRLQCQGLSHRWLSRLHDAQIETPLEGLCCPDGRALPPKLMELLRQKQSSTLSLEVGWAEDTFTLHAWCERREHSTQLSVLLTTPNGLEEQDWARIKGEYELILSAAGEGIYGLDKEGRATFANTASTRILGWRAHDILGRKTHDIHHHSHADGQPYPVHECPIYAALKDGEVHRVDDEVFWHEDGTPVPVEYISSPIIRHGKIDGAVIVFRDIRERKAHEQQREADFAQIRQLKEALEQERDFLRQEIQVTGHYADMIGDSPALKRTLTQIEAVANTPSNVLILGESGVGKEMVARAIHQQSQRANGPLVKVNCASVPKDLFESEFFGHVRGAFTSAHKDRVGRLQMAHGGTLFLDEVGEIPIGLQSKLLRALQEQEFERVGDERTIQVNVRIVAATNRDLLQEVKAGRFREDLYYRLGVFPIEVPALRQRMQDIPLLAQHFLQQNCQELGRPALQLTKAQAKVLQQHPWPGNIRELKNVVERATILSRGNKLNLALALPEATPEQETQAVEEESLAEGFLTDAQFRELEKNNLAKAMKACGGKIAGKDGAAARLGLKPSTLTYRLQQLGLRG